MAYPAKMIANYFIKKAIEEKDSSLTLMKLLKEIYIAHGWRLAIYDKPLISEPIEAWKYGPVISDIYNCLKHYGLRPIDKTIESLDFDEHGKIIKNKFESDFDQETKELLDKIWSVHKAVTGIQLSNWSHDPRGPWYETCQQGKFQFFNLTIPNDLIKGYFKGLGKQNADNISQ